MTDGICSRCGVAFMLNTVGRPRKYCRTCKSVRIAYISDQLCAVELCDKTTIARGLCSAHYSKQSRVPRFEIVCAECGRSAKVKRKSSRHCSPECGSRSSLRLAHAKTGERRRVELEQRRPFAQLELYTGPRTPARVTVAHTYGGNRAFKCGDCRICGRGFVTLYTDVTCSAECQQKHERRTKRIHKDRRRALERKAFIEDVSRHEVFERDGYRCHLCGRKTDRRQTVPHPRSPTIDHIVPLARGGKHERSNCRTACFRCNCIKQDGGGGEQLLLAV